MWVVRPGEDVLRSPLYMMGEVPPWPSREARAICRDHPEHVPPVAGCHCGIYADHSMRIAEERAHAFPATVRRWSIWSLLETPASELLRVIGRVTLERAEIVPIRVPVVDFAGIGIARRITPDELRAAAADIVDLYVYHQDARMCGVPEVAVGLASRYGVPVHYLRVPADPGQQGPDAQYRALHE
jgi:hypothetical protein